jgi:hypothetical protein
MALLKAFSRALAKPASKGKCGCWLIMSALLFSSRLEAPADIPEYQVKAVFLFNFAQFVHWPPEAFPEAQAPLVIGVLGDDPFGPYLDETVRGEKVNTHPLVVRRYRRVEEIKSCHVLFISQSEANRLEQIIASLKGRNILTVSDANDFGRRGGMVGLVTEKTKIRMRIKLEAVKAANLTISSKMLRVAEIES